MNIPNLLDIDGQWRLSSSFIDKAEPYIFALCKPETNIQPRVCGAPHLSWLGILVNSASPVRRRQFHDFHRGWPGDSGPLACNDHPDCELQRFSLGRLDKDNEV